MKIEVQDEKDLGVKTVTQRAVWRDRTTPATNGLPSKIFWDVWLTEYHYIATDTMQTSDGRAFWNLRVEDAFNKGLSIYLFDRSSDTKKLEKILDFADFIKMTNDGKIWGSTIDYQKRRLIMTDKDLHPGEDVVCEF